MSHEDHKRRAPGLIGVALITISDTRTMADDASGAIAKELIGGAGHVMREYRILKDDQQAVRTAVLELASRKDLRAVILSGGTGISQRDTTYEAVVTLLEKRLDGFGELFRALSFEEIGSAAMLTRAVGGILRDKVVFCLPGSSAGVRLALEKLILPELGHIVAEIDKQRGARAGSS